MKAKNIGIFSAIFASICCVGPLVLILLGLGTLGMGAIIGKYHWWFLGGGVLLVTIAWKAYFKENKVCELKSCQMENKRLTQVILILATLIVIFFAGLNLYSYLGNSLNNHESTTVINTKTVIISVERMSCFTCEVTVVSALKRVKGVISATASVKKKSAKVIYDPGKTSIEQLIEAINKTGYKATIPK